MPADDKLRDDPEAVRVYRDALAKGGVKPQVVDAMSDAEVVTRVRRILDALTGFSAKVVERLRDNPGHDA